MTHIIRLVIPVILRQLHLTSLRLPQFEDQPPVTPFLYHCTFSV